MNDIKINGITAAVSAKLERKDAPVEQKNAATSVLKEEHDITVSNQLGTLANKMMADNTVPDNSQRILELKQLVETRQYKVDINGLADKLSRSMLIFN